MLIKLKKKGEDTRNLERKIEKQKITKPKSSTVCPELNSICCDFLRSDDLSFDGYVQLKSIGKEYGKIKIPIKFHRLSNKWRNKNAVLMSSFLFSDRYINFRWDLETPKLKTDGVTVGADQGIKDVLTFSDGIRTPKYDIHGYSLEEITRKLARKVKGSDAFDRAQIHRESFINWSINQLNLDDVKEIRLEEIVNIRYKKHTSRFLSHFSNPLIRDKVLKVGEERGVRVTEQASPYRSQRCHCGWVQKSNRNGKIFKCKKCGYTEDSDVNAAQNHLIDLPTVPAFLFSQKLNQKGFYWNPNGFYNADGVELTVPLSQELNA
jgi:transposase